MVKFELVDVGEMICLPVKIRDNILSDGLIYDWTTLGLACSISILSEGELIMLETSDKKTLVLPMQKM